MIYNYYMGVTCCQSDECCEAPANLESKSQPTSLPKCFRCGLPVCTSCSNMIFYFDYGRKRICNNCRIECECKLETRHKSEISIQLSTTDWRVVLNALQLTYETTERDVPLRRLIKKLETALDKK